MSVGGVSGPGGIFSSGQPLPNPPSYRRIIKLLESLLDLGQPGTGRIPQKEWDRIQNAIDTLENVKAQFVNSVNRNAKIVPMLTKAINCMKSISRDQGKWGRGGQIEMDNAQAEINQMIQWLKHPD